MSLQDDNKAVVCRLIEDGFNARNLDIVRGLFSPDFVNHEPVGGVKLPKGPESMVLQYQTYWEAFPDIKADYHSTAAEGNIVWAYDTLSGTHTGEFMGVPGSGKEFAVEVFHHYRLENGKLAERHGLVDVLKLLQQLGILPKQIP